ncbi:MAG: hypothetical protein WCK93_11025 [Nitrosomonadales bacterium]
MDKRSGGFNGSTMGDKLAKSPSQQGRQKIGDHIQISQVRFIKRIALLGIKKHANELTIVKQRNGTT